MGQRGGDKALEEQKVVADASVVAKWFLVEEHSEKAVQLRDAFATEKIAILVPSLLFYEALNTLRFSGVYSEEELIMAARSLSKYGFQVWEPRGKILENTVQISMKHEATVYDAAYIALSQEASATLYTADSELIQKFPGQARHIEAFKAKGGGGEHGVV
ncbi:MAG: type II toxin-antitoxin system VapC family toxin [Candidatus Geothermarchaeales archaeon]